MTEKRNQHVVPHPDGWAIKPAGADKPTAVLPRQSDAIDRARATTQRQGTELFIHGRNGQIRERDSHGKDDFPPKG